VAGLTFPVNRFPQILSKVTGRKVTMRKEFLAAVIRSHCREYHRLRPTDERPMRQHASAENQQRQITSVENFAEAQFSGWLAAVAGALAMLNRMTEVSSE
jgi:hypothetical protein